MMNDFSNQDLLMYFPVTVPVQNLLNYLFRKFHLTVNINNITVKIFFPLC